MTRGTAIVQNDVVKCGGVPLPDGIALSELHTTTQVANDSSATSSINQSHGGYPTSSHNNQNISNLETSQTSDVGSDHLGNTSNSEEHNDYPDGGLQAYSVLLGSFLGLTANFGCLNSVGAIQTYLATHQLSDVRASTVSWIFSIYLALAFTLTIFVGPYFDRNGSLKPMLLGNSMVFGGLMATANCTEVWQFILALSLCVGVGHSLCTSPLVGVISHWFYIRIGLAIGISSIGGSIGGVAMPLMLRSLYEKVGFAWAIRVLAFFCLALNGVATLLIKERFRDSTQQLPLTHDDGSNKVTETRRKQFIQSSKRFFDYSAVKDLKFVFLVLGVLFGEVSLLSVVTYYGTYAVTQGMSESQSYILLTIFNAVGVLGRACPGYFSDKFGHFNVMILMILGSTISILCLWLPFGSNHAILYVFILIFGFTSSLILSLTPACLRQITPVREFGSRYGLMYFFVSLGNLFGIPLGSAIIGDSSRYHYIMFSLFCGLVSLLSSCFWLISRFRTVGLKFNVKI